MQHVEFKAVLYWEQLFQPRSFWLIWLLLILIEQHIQPFELSLVAVEQVKKPK